MKRVLYITLLAVIVSAVAVLFHEGPEYEGDQYIRSGEEQFLDLPLESGWTYKVVVEQCGADLETFACSNLGTVLSMDRLEVENRFDYIYLTPKLNEKWQVKAVLGKGVGDECFFRLSYAERWKTNDFSEELTHLQAKWVEAKKLLGDVSTIFGAESIFNENISYYYDVGDYGAAGQYAAEIGLAFLYLGQNQEALAYTDFAIELFSLANMNDKKMDAQITMSVADFNLYLSTKSPDYAVDALRRLFSYLSYHQSMKDEEKIANAMVNISAIFQVIGFYEEAVKILEEFIRNSPGATPMAKMGARNNLALLYSGSLNDVDRALPHVLETEKMISDMPSKEIQAAGLNQVAAIYIKARLYNDARIALERAVLLAKGKDPVLLRNINEQLATSYMLSGEKNKARELYLDLLNGSEAKGHLLYSLATMEDDHGKKLDLFRASCESLSPSHAFYPHACLNVSKLTGSSIESKTQLLKAIQSVDSIRSLYSDQNMRTGTLQKYFDVFSYAIERELSLSGSSSDKHVRKAFEILESVMGKSVRESLVLGVNKSRKEIDVEKLKLEDSESWDLVYRQLSGRKIITEDVYKSLDQIQAAIGPGTLILVTYQSEAMGFNWLLWEDGFLGFKSEGEDSVEALVSAFREVVEKGDMRSVLANDAGRKLCESLFPPDFELSRFNRLAVVTDGAMAGLPFGALPISGNRFLIQDMDIVFLPTASHATQLSAGRNTPRKDIAVFSNPVFSLNDKRYQKRPISVPTAKRSSDATLPRLAGTEKEASTIVSLSLSGQQATRSLSGFNATRAAAMDPSLADYRILHFATHCQIDPVDSSKSKLIFSRFDKDGRPIPSELTLADISEMKLNADLVVLSACETALGKRVRGAGPMSISRGFMLAGVPHVAATLWSIDDKASPVLMKYFYTAMLEEGMTASAALCDAQRKMLSHPQWSAPKYWSAFILLGDWR